MKVAYTRNQAPGAIPNGAVVEKVNSEPEDTHLDGVRATVVGSWGPTGVQVLLKEGNLHRLPDQYFYFVEWEDRPGLPVGIGGHRIRVPERQNGNEP